MNVFHPSSRRIPAQLEGFPGRIGISNSEFIMEFRYGGNVAGHISVVGPMIISTNRSRSSLE